MMFQWRPMLIVMLVAFSASFEPVSANDEIYSDNARFQIYWIMGFGIGVIILAYIVVFLAEYLKFHQCESTCDGFCGRGAAVCTRVRRPRYREPLKPLCDSCGAQRRPAYSTTSGSTFDTWSSFDF